MKRAMCLVFCTLVLALPARSAGQAEQSAQGAADWQTASEAGRRLPGVEPSRVSGDLTIVTDAATRPLAVALLERFEKEGYRGLAEVIDTEKAGRRADRAELRLVTLNHGEVLQSKGSAALVPLAQRSAVFALGAAVPAGASIPRADVPRLLRHNGTWSDFDSAWPAERIVRLLPTPEDTLPELVEDTLGNEEPLHGRVIPNPGERLGKLAEIPGGVALTEYAAVRRFRGIRTLGIDGIGATDKTVSRGSYPLTWQTVLTVPRADLGQSAAAAFTVFVATYAAEEVTSLGWYPVPQWQSADAVLQALEEET